MPIHDWTRVRANRFHHFHQDWSIEIARMLNRGVLPPGYVALAEQKAIRREPDVLALAAPGPRGGPPAGTRVADAAPQARHVARVESDAAGYARRANRIAVRDPDGELVAAIEIVSPGNKDSRHAIQAFTRKAVAFLRAGVNLIVVDLFPPNPRTPRGMHRAIWDRLGDDPFEPPADKPLTAAAYVAGDETVGYVEPLAVGDRLPDLPLFLAPDWYVPCPLEAAYAVSWAAYPAALKGPLEAGG